MSIVIPPPAPSSEAHSKTAVSDSHCAFTSDSGSASSTWVPAGVYVPIHRRSGSSTSTDTYVADAAALPSPRSRPNAHEAPFTPDPKRERQRQPEPQNPGQEPKPRMRTYTYTYTYTRTALLSLAPSSLIYTSLRPTISPALLAAHPRILRARGDGVVRALEMARSDLSTPLVPAVPSVPRALHGGAHSTYAAEPKTTDLKRARAARVQMQSASALPPAPAPSPGPHPQQTERRRRDRRRPRPRPRPNRRNRNTNLALPIPLAGGRTSTHDNKPTLHPTTPLPPNAIDSRSKHTSHRSPGDQRDPDAMRTATWRPQPLPPPAQAFIAA